VREVGHTDSAWQGKWRQRYTDSERFTRSLDREVCNTAQPPKTGSAIVARDWAPRRSRSRDFKLEILSTSGQKREG